jgi:hypothetical protein
MWNARTSTGSTTNGASGPAPFPRIPIVFRALSRLARERSHRPRRCCRPRPDRGCDSSRDRGRPGRSGARRVLRISVLRKVAFRSVPSAPNHRPVERSRVIFFTGLSIDENSQFEGSSQQVENPTDAPSVDAKGPQKKAGPRSATVYRSRSGGCAKALARA